MSGTASVAAGPYFVGIDVGTGRCCRAGQCGRRGLPDLEMAVQAMASIRDVFVPAAGGTAAAHDARFAMFERLQALAREVARRGEAAPA